MAKGFGEKRVLVTGATGLIGSHVVRRLVTEGASVRATLHRAAPVVKEPGVEYVSCDLTRGDDCRKLVRGIHWVMHCAANTSGAATIASTPMVHVTPNILMNSQLLEAAYEEGVEKFLWLGSTVAYPVSENPVKEEEMLQGQPFEKYFFAGWAKRFTEILCQMYGERLARKMTTIVLRPTNVYGPGDDFDFATSHVIPAMIRKVVERWNPIEVWGTGKDVRDAIYVDDMVDAMMTAIVKIDSYVAINIGLGRGYTVDEILRLILKLDGFSDAKVVYDASKPTMIPKRLIDTSRAAKLLQFRARVDLQEGLRRTIEWYKRNRQPSSAGAPS